MTLDDMLNILGSNDTDVLVILGAPRLGRDALHASARLRSSPGRSTTPSQLFSRIFFGGDDERISFCFYGIVCMCNTY